MWLKKLFDRSRADPTTSARFKEVVYRCGLIVFSIPSDWLEFYDQDGGGLFYADEPDSGALRLNVTTYTAPNESLMIGINTEADSRANLTGGQSYTLDNGNSLVTYETDAVENGIDIAIRFWELYNAVNPVHMRVAIFSFTLLRNQMKQQKFVHQLDMLDEQIRIAEFAERIGIIPD